MNMVTVVYIKVMYDLVIMSFALSSLRYIVFGVSSIVTLRTCLFLCLKPQGSWKLCFLCSKRY